MADCEWTCERCGETFDARKVSHLQHKCLIAKESVEFDEALSAYLSEPAGQFAMYYARRLINGSIGTDNTLVT